MFQRNTMLALTLMIATALAVPCHAGFKPGDALPDLGSFELQGELPNDLKGKVILLDFWASWCAPCRKSFPVMQELTAKYTGHGLVVVAVDVDEKPENMRRFLQSIPVSFTVVRDVRQKLVAAADVPTMPTSFLVDRSGKIRFMHAGFDADQTRNQYVKEIQQLLEEPQP